jgi:hypothetical protein
MHIENILEVADRKSDSEPLKVSLRPHVKALFKGKLVSVKHLKYSLESLTFIVYNNNYTIIFKLSQLPFNCGVIVLGFVELRIGKMSCNRKEVLAKEIPKILELCALMGYTKVITTTNSEYKLKEFVENGFIEIKDLNFVNKRTNNTIYTALYEIEYEEEEEEDESIW